MAAQPASTVPTISPAEMQILISRSGLVLNPGQMADLVLAWRQVAGLIAAIPQGRPLADDMALTFRLPSPGGTATRPAESTASGRAPKPAVKPGKPAAKPARKAARAAAPAKASTKATAKTPAKAPSKARTKSKAPARHRASRGR